jgi:hypothetical protein
MDNLKLHYDDISIVPEIVTDINSRNECDPFIDGMLPIFATPMGSVLDEYNWRFFMDHYINVVIPRTINIITRLNILYETTVVVSKNKPFVSFSLNEAKEFILYGDSLDFVKYKDEENSKCRICIDLANGHMCSLLELIKDIKEKYGTKVEIMSGNIANPKSYKLYNDVGCDYVRTSIGTGSACLTASNTGIYYPPFSLLQEIDEIRKQCDGKCKVIADGGIKGFRDIQKALIYADYVMIGGLFNKCIESSGITTYGKSWIKIGKFKIRNYIVDLFRAGKPINKDKYSDIMRRVKSGMLEVNKMFYGMSTKYAQTETHSNEKLKTSEGIIKTQKVEYSLNQWVENEISYLRSAMSYTNSKTLADYKESQWIHINGITHNK